jgi:hypothetical protein
MKRESDDGKDDEDDEYDRYSLVDGETLNKRSAPIEN